MTAYSPISWMARLRATRYQLVLRLIIVASPMLALVFINAAADSSVVALDLAIIGLAIVCAVVPDSHLGLLVVALIGVDWLITVPISTTPWVMGAALALALFHTSMAAASVAPLATPLPISRRRSFSRRYAVVAAISLPMWLLTTVAQRTGLDGNSDLLAFTLLLLAIAIVWMPVARLSH